MKRFLHPFWFCVLLLNVAGFILLYPHSYQQDGGLHHLLAKWCWKSPELFLSPWSRPLFTLLYSLPAQGGYLLSRIFTGGILCATGWIAFQIARDLGFRRAWLVYPFLILQPAVLLLSSDTMTEPLFALFLSAALLLYLRNRPFAAAILVSLLPLVRPEGFFIGVSWGFVMLADRNVSERFLWRWPKTLILLTGTIAWWLAAWAFTGNVTWILDTWPWQGKDRLGHAALEWYGRIGFETAGLLVFPLAVVGSFREWISRRRIVPLLVAWFCFFQVVLWQFGLFGSAGYARYFVCISPLIALVAVSAVETWKRGAMIGVAVGAVFSWGVALYVVDAHLFLPDARAAREMHRWYRENDDRPVDHLIWSQSYMCILFDGDVRQNRIDMTGTAEKNRRIIREAPSGTLIFWDSTIGPAWFKIGPADFEEAGYRRIHSRKYELRPLFASWDLLGFPAFREQEMYFYRRR